MQRGFSFVEVIIAISLVVVALVPLAQLVATGIRNGLMTRARTTTVLLAERKLEELRALPWGALSTVGGAVDYLDGSGVVLCPGATAPCDGTVYVRTSSVALSPFNSGVLLIQVEVTTVGDSRAATKLTTARARRTP